MTEEEEEEERKSDHFPWHSFALFEGLLPSFCPPSLLPSARTFRGFCLSADLRHTKHCSTPCTIYQRAASSMEPGFGLELGLAVSLSWIHPYITHCTAIFLSSCLLLCLSLCLLLAICPFLDNIIKLKFLQTDLLSAGEEVYDSGN